MIDEDEPSHQASSPSSNLPDKPNQTLRARADRRRRLESVIAQVVRETRSFSGPIPPPDLLAGYDEIVPGAADRIIKMAEKEQAHRHEVESSDLRGSLTLASRGQLIAGGLAVIALLGGLSLVIMNKDVQGFSVIVGDAVLFGGAFIIDRFSNRPSKEESSEPSKNDDDEQSQVTSVLNE